MKETIAEYIVPVTQDGRDVMFDFLRATMLIRCKDCAEWKVRCGIKKNYCGKIGCVVGEDDFCSKAESKEK